MTDDNLAMPPTINRSLIAESLKEIPVAGEAVLKGR